MLHGYDKARPIKVARRKDEPRRGRLVDQCYFDMAVKYRQLRRQRSLIIVIFDIYCIYSVDHLVQLAVTLYPYLSLGFLLSVAGLLRYVPVEWIPNLD